MSQSNPLWTAAKFLQDEWGSFFLASQSISHTTPEDAASIADEESAAFLNKDIVIPILPANKKRPPKRKMKIRPKGDFLGRVAQVTIHDHFPFELGFAMTAHKAQGRTIARVIIALEDRMVHHLQMAFAAVFVSMSRVKEADNLRLLCHRSPGGRAREPFSCLTELRPRKEVMQFYSGYTNDNGKRDRKRALANVF